MNQRGFIIPSFLFDPRVWAAMAIVGAALGAWWYVHSLHSQIKELEEWRENILVSLRANKAEEDRLKAANDEHTKEVANGYAAAIRSITTDYDSRIKRLLHAGGDPRTATGVPEAAAGTDERPSDTRFGAGAEAPALADICTQLEKDAAVTTVQLLYLQHWIRGVK